MEIGKPTEVIEAPAPVEVPAEPVEAPEPVEVPVGVPEEVTV